MKYEVGMSATWTVDVEAEDEGAAAEAAENLPIEKHVARFENLDAVEVWAAETVAGAGAGEEE